MPASDSTIHDPPLHIRRIDRMTPKGLSALEAWASDLCEDQSYPAAVHVMAATLCHLLDMRGRAGSPGVRALIDARIATLLNDLRETGLTP